MRVRFAERSVVEKVLALGNREFTAATLQMGRDGWRRLKPLVKLGVLKVVRVDAPGGMVYRSTGWTCDVSQI